MYRVCLDFRLQFHSLHLRSDLIVSAICACLALLIGKPYVNNKSMKRNMNMSTKDVQSSN
jgi:hypothetical protein